jgi:hypothetical protein
MVFERSHYLIPAISSKSMVSGRSHYLIPAISSKSMVSERSCYLIPALSSKSRVSERSHYLIPAISKSMVSGRSHYLIPAISSKSMVFERSRYLIPALSSKSRVSERSIQDNFYISLLTVREEHRLGVFETRVLRRIFGPKRDEVTGEWRQLHTEELHYLYSSLSIIRIIKAKRMRWAGQVARTFGFHKLLGNYRVSKQLGISGVVLSSMELVSYLYKQNRKLIHE